MNATIAVRGVVDWQELGCQLNYNPEKLSLLLTFGQTPEDSREKMISDWAMQADATWDKLVRALDQMGERQLARTIHQEFISPRAGGELSGCRLTCCFSYFVCICGFTYADSYFASY